jgi:hypothetical protein
VLPKQHRPYDETGDYKEDVYTSKAARQGGPSMEENDRKDRNAAEHLDVKPLDTRICGGLQ